jgi:hypothetical protein
LSLPGWLAPFPRARQMTAKASPAEATSAYTALAKPPAVAAHYSEQLRAAGIAFETKQDGADTVIQAPADKDYCIIHIGEDGDGAKVQVTYAPGSNPPPPEPAPDLLPELRLEWPLWLGIEGAQPLSQRTNPSGRVGGAAGSCPGDALGKPSRGCLQRVFESSSTIRDVFGYFESILENHGYTAQSPGRDAYANPQLWKKVADVNSSMRMREYPEPREPEYYRQIDVSLRQPLATGSTKVELTFLVHNPPGVEPRINISGTWAFTHFDGRFQGLIKLKESEWAVTGTWRTTKGKVEPDDQVVCVIEGRTVQLTRYIGRQFQQSYTLTLSDDGNRLDGFGEGYFLNHTNLNMQRAQ